jgi:hypothetical protein
MNNNNTKTTDMECPFTVKFDKYPTMAKHFNELLLFLSSSEHFTDLDINGIWQILDTMSYEERMKKVTKQIKRKKVKQALFKADGLTKPPNRMNLFRKKFKQECKDEGREYSKEYFTTAYEALSDEKIAELEKECTELRKEYEEQYNTLRLKAMFNGEYPLDKPKGACSNYMIFNKACHSKDSNLLSKSQISVLKKAEGSDFKTMIATIKSLWDKLKVEEKAKFTKLSVEDKQRYKYQMYEYEILSLEAQIRFAQSNNETIRVSELESELTELRDNEPDGYSDYTSSDDYTPLFDYSQFE